MAAQSVKNLAAWTLFRQLYEWPAERPAVTEVSSKGWLSEGTKAMLRGHLQDGTVIVELGAWLGLSSRWILSECPTSVLISIDHFKGGPELDRHKDVVSKLPALYYHRCWPFRDRLVVLPMEMAPGLRTVYRAGLDPAMIYVDGDHSMECVLSDALLAGALFPAAILVGDDWARQTVRDGATEAAKHLGRELTANDRAWAMRPKEG